MKDTLQRNADVNQVVIHECYRSTDELPHTQKEKAQEVERLTRTAGLELLYDTTTDDESYHKAGFRGQIYRDLITGKIHTVCRGTVFDPQTGLANIITDANILANGHFDAPFEDCIWKFADKVNAVHALAQQQENADAKEMGRKPREIPIKCNGHSLGGAAASMLGFILFMTNTTNVSTICTDPVGVTIPIEKLIRAYQALPKSLSSIVSTDKLRETARLIRPNLNTEDHAEKCNAFLDEHQDHFTALNVVFAAKCTSLTRQEYLLFTPVSSVHIHAGKVAVITFESQALQEVLNRDEVSETMLGSAFQFAKATIFSLMFNCPLAAGAKIHSSQHLKKSFEVALFTEEATQSLLWTPAQQFAGNFINTANYMPMKEFEKLIERHPDPTYFGFGPGYISTDGMIKFNQRSTKEGLSGAVVQKAATGKQARL